MKQMEWGRDREDSAPWRHSLQLLPSRPTVGGLLTGAPSQGPTVGGLLTGAPSQDLPHQGPPPPSRSQRSQLAVEQVSHYGRWGWEKIYRYSVWYPDFQ